MVLANVLISAGNARWVMAVTVGITYLLVLPLTFVWAVRGGGGVVTAWLLQGLGRLAIGETWPDLTIVLDVPPEVGFERTKRSPKTTRRPRKSANSDQLNMFADAQVDAMERRPLDFHRRVRENFRDLPTFYPAPVEVIDGTPDPDAVFAAVQEALKRAFQ